MLETIRSGIGSWFVKIFLGLLIASFAVWGIGDMFRTAIDSSVAVVGGEKITASNFINEFNRQLQVMRNRFGGQLDSRTAVQLGLADSVAQRMVDRLALDQMAQRLGLAITDQQVRQSIWSNPAFQNEFGDFDQFRFNRIMNDLRMTERQFVEDSRNDLARSELISALVAGATAPKSLAEALYRHRFEKRAAEFFVVKDSDVAAPAAPDDDTLAAYHQAHAEEYTAPEYRTAHYLVLNPADIAVGIEISDDDLRAAYDQRKGEFGSPDKRTIEQLILASRERALEVRAGASDGMAFLQAALDLDGSTLEDITLGTLDRQELAETVGDEIADQVFALEEGVVSEPIETPFGWHLFRVSEIHPADVRSFDDVAEELREKMRLERATDALYDFANGIDDDIAGGAAIDEIATKVGLKLRTAGPLDRSGRDRAGQPLKGLPASPVFLSTVFTKEIGDDLYLDETDEGGYMLVQVDDIEPSALKPLDEVRPQVVAAWTTEQRHRAARERAEKLVDTAKLGGDFAALAASLGRKLEKSASFGRDGAGARPAMSRQLIGQLFDLREGFTIAPTIAGDGFVVAKLTGVTPGDPASDPAGLTEVQRSLRQGLGNDVLSQYQVALSRRLNIQINRGLMMSLFDNPNNPALGY